MNRYRCNKPFELFDKYSSHLYTIPKGATFEVKGEQGNKIKLENVSCSVVVSRMVLKAHFYKVS